jgi:hypothetical protein
MTLQPDPYPRLLGLILQSDSLKLGLCKFNIINISLGSGVTATPRTLGYKFTKKSNTFRF